MLIFVSLHIFYVALVIGATYLVGRSCLPGKGLTTGLEAAAVSIGLGLGILSVVVSGLGALGMMRKPVVWGMLATIAAVSFPVWRALPGGLARSYSTVRAMPANRLALLAVAALPVCAVVALMVQMALYPPTDWDTTAYHLTVAKRFATSHHIQATPDLVYPVFTLNVHMLFTLMMLLADDVSIHLLSLSMTLLVALVLLVWGRELYSERVGAWAALLWLARPYVVGIGTAAYADTGLVLFVTLACYSFMRWLASRATHWIVIGAVFAGLAAGAKPSALALTLLLGVWTLGIAFRERRWGHVVIFAVVSLAVCAPWYVFCWAHTGNPFFPFGSHVFPTLGYDSTDYECLRHDYARYGVGKGLSSLLLLPVNLISRHDRFNHFDPLLPLGMAALVVMPFMSCSRVQSRRVALIALAYTGLWFASCQHLRYLLPVIPLYALLTAGALDAVIAFAVRRLPAPTYAWVALPLAAILMTPTVGYAWSRCRARGPVPVTRAEREEYLASNVPGYRAIQYLNDLKGSDYTVYAISLHVLTYYADGRFLGQVYGPARFERVTSRMHSVDELHKALRESGAGWLLAPEGVDHFFSAWARRWTKDWHRVQADPAFERRFRPAFSDGHITLYEVLPH
jgi:hypothetical protein